ncbi:BRCA1-associated RING domain protein 1 isoform X2 [Sphaeramia orbicularis]|uniref:BRCA1-associated RING domain protein 1 isoform X2 n=1 Tax=Sphaeramia orbicularis TaxID=375764 RepID=UPI00117CB267|nr:BRCA1-associated RING domain protein 1 isoform X2 [Sphaeramia orbicularis]
MDEDAVMQTEHWVKTKEAVANFRRLLLCSKCSNLMREPVCLGMCEHLLCRSCAGPQAGDGCAVCHSPAWVKDIQINRQLSSIIQLFSGLESLLNPIIEDSPSKAESPALKQKKNFKIWFSPRSRKIRCMVEKPSEDVAQDGSSCGETVAAQPDTLDIQSKDLSVFNFTSSSQDSSSSCSQTCNRGNRNRNKRSTKKNPASRRAKVQGATRTTRKQTEQNMKKQRLEAINQQWGITEEVHALKEQPCSESPRRSSKRVSFVSPAVTSDEPQLDLPQGSTNELSPGTDTTRENLSESRLHDQIQTSPGILDSFVQHTGLPADELTPNDSTEKQDSVSSPRPSSKRSKLEEKVTHLETTPKRPRASPGRRRKSPGQMTPSVLNPPSSSSPKCGKSPREGQAGSPPIQASAGRKSPRSPLGHPTSGSPAVMKRNHKGETPLHLAAIKGDVEAVKELLDQGADPNLKDNAGWTPLHEACNLGHLKVVEVLVSKGALLNTPGYENDSPLHDAVRNGHPAIARLLLQLGASQNVLNLYGKKPADYAASLEMLEIFQEATEGGQYANTTHSPSMVSLHDNVTNCAGKNDMTVVVLASNLSHTEQRQLAKLGQLLGWRMADTFTGTVSHVVVPEGHMPTTYTTLRGLLAGCWIVKYSWVEACLQAGEWMPEIQHEAGEGPQRSRINRCSLLPSLFDGCFFFLLGSFTTPTKDKLTKLLQEGGGQLLRRQPKPDSDVTQTLNAAAYHAIPGSDQALCTQYILFDPQGPHKPTVIRRGKVWSAPSTWVIECIAAFSLLPIPNL